MDTSGTHLFTQPTCVTTDKGLPSATKSDRKNQTHARRGKGAERRRLKEPLSLQTPKQQMFVTNPVDVVIRVDQGLCCHYLAPALTEKAGPSPWELLDKCYAGQEKPNAPWHTAAVRTFATGRPHSIAFRCRTHEGVRCYRVRTIPEYANDGSVESVLSIISDVTDFKHTEQTLRESERFVHATLDALSEHICVLDGQGVIVAVNKAWREFAKANAAKIRMVSEGANYLAVCDATSGPESRDAKGFAGGIRAILRGERDQFVMEYTCHSLTEAQWFSGKATRFPGEGRVRVVVAHTDITERKAAELALRSAKENMETALQETEAARAQEKARRYEVEQRQHIAEGLRDVVSYLNSTRSLEEVLNYIVLQAGHLLDSQEISIYQAQGGLGRPVALATQTRASRCPENTEPYRDRGALRQAMLTQQAVAIHDTAADSCDLCAPIAEKQKGSSVPNLTDRTRAILAVPVIVACELYGGIVLQYAEPRTFSGDEIGLAVAFSEQVALAIESASLKEQIMHTAVTAERHRLARELHDAVTQALFSANVIAESLPQIWEQHPEQGRRGLEELRQLTRGALTEMRMLLVELHPAATTEKPLGEVLRRLPEAFSNQMRASITLSVENDQRLPPDVQIALYRITQEALHNVAKHAEAHRVTVSLRNAPEQVTLSICDDGRGFDPALASPDHYGVDIMRERAQSIGATIDISSQPGNGTSIEARWPRSEGRKTSWRSTDTPVSWWSMTT